MVEYSMELWIRKVIPSVSQSCRTRLKFDMLALHFHVATTWLLVAQIFECDVPKIF